MATEALRATERAAEGNGQEPHQWRILISSQGFYPRIGGIETVTRILAEEFTELGHQVTVVTLDQASEPDRFPFRVVRRPRPARLWREVAACDIYWQNHIGLKTAWPALFLRKPWVVTLQGGIGRGYQRTVKRAALENAVCVSISNFVAAQEDYRVLVIRNPYDDRVFRRQQTMRLRELVFVGRMNPEKGATVLPEVVYLLGRRGLQTNLAVVGDGPERELVMRQCLDLGLGGQVESTGVRQGVELAGILNAHQILVVPSLWDEPFGIVALEGIACGCVVVGFDSGGLREAVGPCGVLVPRGDTPALADAIEELLRDPDRQDALRARAEEHLAQFSRRRVASNYLKLFQSLLNNGE